MKRIHCFIILLSSSIITTCTKFASARSFSSAIMLKAGEYCDPNRKRPDNAFQLGVGQVAKQSETLRVNYNYYFTDGKQLELGGSGGCMFNADLPRPVSIAKLMYSVYVPKGFPLVTMGKLPGLLGTSRSVKDIDNYDCVGGHSREYCFSVRIMWKLDPKTNSVNLFPYIYVQDGTMKNLCPDYAWDCPAKYGTFLKMTGMQMKEGQNHDISLTVETRPNGKGRVVMSVNGVTKSMDNIPFWTRGKPMKIARVLNTIHVGGKKETWPKEYFNPKLNKNPLYMDFSNYRLQGTLD